MHHSSSGSNRKVSFGALILTAVFLAIVPATSFAREPAQRHKHDHDRHFGKCGKFVNCHDARDGRWDGRGRRSNTISVWNQRHNNWRNVQWRNNRSNNRVWTNRTVVRRWTRVDNNNRRWRQIGSRDSRWRRN